MDRGVGIVEQLERRLGRNGALRNNSDSTSRDDAAPIAEAEQIFAVLQQLEVGFGLRLEPDAARGGEAGAGSRVRSSPR